MTNPFTFDALQSILHQRIEQLPDHRKGHNTQYRITDAALGACGILFTPSPSFLEYQRRLQQHKGHKNAHTLFGVEQIPCDHQVRKLLDLIMPSELDPVCVGVFEGLEHHGALTTFRVLNNQLLSAMDGTNSFSSKSMHCPNCLSRHTSGGHTLYDHSAITPVGVSPGHSEVIALPPEVIMPQDGQDQQDCERAAGKRWMVKHAASLAPHGVTLRGDDLSSNQPLCALALQHGCNFLFVCKPASHATLYEQLALWQANDAMGKFEQRHWHGRFTAVATYRSVPDVLLRGGREALSVHWLAITLVHATTGAQLYHNSCMTNHAVTTESVAQVAQAGRGRWKIDNDNNHVLKTKGYHVEHNFDHGKTYLSAFLLSLNLLAFLFHTVVQRCDDKYALLRQALVRRQTFVDDLRALTRYRVFDSWHHLMDVMIRGLELTPKLDTG